MTFLSPNFLTSNIATIALLISGVGLVIFSDFILRTIVIPVSMKVRDKSKKSIQKKGNRFIAKYTSEGLATVLFLIYCFFGIVVIADYVFEPILKKMQSFILIVVIVLFLIISYVINTARIRKKFMKI